MAFLMVALMVALVFILPRWYRVNQRIAAVYDALCAPAAPSTNSVADLSRARFLGQLYGLERLASSHQNGTTCTSEEGVRGLVATRDDAALAAAVHAELSAGPNEEDPARFARLRDVWNTPHDPAAAIASIATAWNPDNPCALTDIGATGREIAALILTKRA